VGVAARHCVVALVGEQSSVFDLAVAYEIFGHDPCLDVPWYRFLVATESPGRTRLDLGLELTVEHGLSALTHADTVIVAGKVRPSPAIVAALRTAHQRGARIVSFCAGTFLLAEAGMLDERTATTHWDATAALASHHPDIDVRHDVLFVDNGDVLTSGGLASAIDLGIHIVRLDHGAAIANQIARHLVVAPQRDGTQAQVVKAPAATIIARDNLAGTLDWMVTHLDEDLSLLAMAEHAYLSVRQFTRRFQDMTGTTPHRWLIRQRVLRAQELLEQANISVEDVAHQSGFRSSAAMRPHFFRHVAMSPGEYRRNFTVV
jgi:AraC family transcriptional activator FtrA